MSSPLNAGMVVISVPESIRNRIFFQAPLVCLEAQVSSAQRTLSPVPRRVLYLRGTSRRLMRSPPHRSRIKTPCRSSGGVFWVEASDFLRFDRQHLNPLGCAPAGDPPLPRSSTSASSRHASFLRNHPNSSADVPPDHGRSLRRSPVARGVARTLGQRAAVARIGPVDDSGKHGEAPFFLILAVRVAPKQTAIRLPLVSAPSR